MGHEDRQSYGDLARYDVEVRDGAFGLSCQDCGLLLFGFIGRNVVDLATLVKAASRHEAVMDESTDVEPSEGDPTWPIDLWWSLVHDARVATERGFERRRSEQTTIPRQPGSADGGEGGR